MKGSPLKTREVLVAVPDLFFSTRIISTAQQLGVEVVACAPTELAACARRAIPDVAIVDLHAVGALDGVRALRADPVIATVRVVGFYSHVDNALRGAAIEAGVTDPMPRSAFTAKLASILSGT